MHAINQSKIAFKSSLLSSFVRITLLIFLAKYFNVSSDYILGLINTPIPLDEREAATKDHTYMPKEFMKNKETRKAYKTIVEYVKLVHSMK